MIDEFWEYKLCTNMITFIILFKYVYVMCKDMLFTQILALVIWVYKISGID